MRLSCAIVWVIASLFTFVQLAKAGEPEQGCKQSSSPFLARVKENLYFTPDNCCGLVAAYMVANDLEYPVALHDLVGRVPVSSAGTTLHDLETFLQSCGFDTGAVELSPEELYTILKRDPQLRVIALIRPAHWITLFSANQGKFDCYNYPERFDLDRAQFARFFANRALLVGPSRGYLDYLRNPSPS